MREAVNAHIAEAERRLRHERLANALEASGHADPETLAIHFRGAGMIERAHDLTHDSPPISSEHNALHHNI